MRKNYTQARAYYEEALARSTGVVNTDAIDTITLLARLERDLGRYREALAWHREAIRRSSQQMFFHQSILLFQALAYTEIACSRDWPAPEAELHLLAAARLLGAAEACRAVAALKMSAYQGPPDETFLAELRGRLDPAKLEQAWAEGLAMPVERAAAYALSY